MAIKQEVLRLEQIVTEQMDAKMLVDTKLNLFMGECIGILGVNNAGKTALAGVIAGFLPCTSGKIYYMEEQVHIQSIIQARDMGIYYIQRKSSLVEDMSVVDNLMLTSSRNSVTLSNRKKIEENVRRVLGIFGAQEIDLDREAGTLSEFHRLVIELCKTILGGAKIVILDNVISGLSIDSKNKVEILLTHLKHMNISVIIIEARFRFLEPWCERLFVVRAGRTVGILTRKEYDQDKIVSLMTGYPTSDIETEYDTYKAPVGKKELLRLEHISTVTGLKDMSFSVYKDELLGILCLGKASQKAIEWLLMGGTQPSEGNIFMDDVNISIWGTDAALEQGIVFVPEDDNVFLEGDIRENILLNACKLTSRSGMLNNAELKYIATELIARYFSEYDDISENIENNRGGWLFHKKIAFCRGLASFPKLMVLVNPTLHNDFMSKSIFYKDILSLKKQNIAGLILSTDLDELFALCDRIIIVKNGKIVEKHVMNDADRSVLEYKYSNYLKDIL